MAFDDNSLVIKSDNIIALGDPAVPLGTGGFKDDETGLFINDAVSVDIIEWKDKRTNTRVSGFTPSIAMSYIAASNGVYRAKVSTAVGDNLLAGREYELEIRAVDTSTTVKTFFLQVFAERGG